MEIARKRIINLEEVLGEYILFQNNSEKFQEHMKKKIEEYEQRKAEENNKNRTKDSLHNDKQQVVSTS
tara:strand:+ start:257 stop:460 length:204 start_codon:yes stop_codon:yes gene_type:complete